MHKALFECKITKATQKPGSNGRPDFTSVAAVLEGRPRSTELEDENGRPLFTVPVTWVSWIHPAWLPVPNPQDEVEICGFPYLSAPSKDGGVFLNLSDVSGCKITRPAPVAAAAKPGTAKPKAKKAEAPPETTDSSDEEPM